MNKVSQTKAGFSLVEMLISLIIVSFAAVSICGLQKMVFDQSRDNFSHSFVMRLITSRFVDISNMASLENIISLNGSSEQYSENGTSFALIWLIEQEFTSSIISELINVQAKISWMDSDGGGKMLIHSTLISKPMSASSEQADFIPSVPNLLMTEKVAHFEPKVIYKEGAYVIYNSQLLQLASPYLLTSSDELGRFAPPLNAQGATTSGWECLGRIDSGALATLFSE